MTQVTLQLAHNIDFSLAKFPLWGFWKIDGVRAGHVRGFVGRSMDPFKNTALNARFAAPVYEGFDGELTMNGWLSADEITGFDEGETLCGLTTGLCNRAKIKKGETALPDNAVWNLFDYLHPGFVDMPYGHRYEFLKINAAGVPHVRVLPYTVINNPEEALAFIDACLDGTAPGLPGPCEGAIFRDPEALHKSGRPGKRDNDFWRFKPESDKDAICTGFEEALTNNNEATTNSLGRTERSAHKENKVGNGMVGTVLGIDVLTGKPIRVGPGKMPHAFRIAAFNSPTLLVGQPFKYCSLDTGVKDAPRQGRFVSLRAKEDMTPEDLALLSLWQKEAA